MVWLCSSSGVDSNSDHSMMPLLVLEVELLICSAVLQHGDCIHLQASHMLEAQRSLLADVDKSKTAQGQRSASVHATYAGADADDDATTGDTSGRRMAESSHLHCFMKGQLAASCCEQYAHTPAQLPCHAGRAPGPAAGGLPRLPPPSAAAQSHSAAERPPSPPAQPPNCTGQSPAGQLHQAHAIKVQPAGKAAAEHLAVWPCGIAAPSSVPLLTCQDAHDCSVILTQDVMLHPQLQQQT